MKCIFCNHPDSKVIDSRPLDEDTIIRRRRECLKCGRRFTTYEKAEFQPIMVIKKDGTRQAFNLEKIKKGMIKACEKRNVSAEAIDEMALEVERKVQHHADQEISAAEIGELVMQALKEKDQVAYVRFASVYREFKDINLFFDELKKLAIEDQTK